jgi:hypothetical protein
VEVGTLVGVDAAHRLAQRAVERTVGLGINPVGRNLGAVMKGRDPLNTSFCIAAVVWAR